MATSYANAGGTGERRHMMHVTESGGIFNNSWIGALIDGAVATNAIWFTAGSLSGAKWIKFNFGSDPYIIDEARFYQQNTSAQGVWQWQGSNDGSAFTAIGSSFTLGGATTQTITALSGNTTAYKQYRLAGVSGTTSTSPYVYEFEFKISPAGRATGTAYSNPGGSGNRAGVVTVTRSSAWDQTGGAANLVDGTSTGGDSYAHDPSPGDWLRFDFGAAKVIDEAAWYVRYDDAASPQGTWKWQGSNDGSTFTDIGSSFPVGSRINQTQAAGIGETATLIFTSLWGNTAGYRYYRFYCVSAPVGANQAFDEFVFRLAPPVVGVAQPQPFVVT